MPVDAARPAVEFSLSVPGAFGSVWALWSAADVAISLATSVHIMDSPLVQLAALGRQRNGRAVVRRALRHKAHICAQR